MKLSIKMTRVLARALRYIEINSPSNDGHSRRERRHGALRRAGCNKTTEKALRKRGLVEDVKLSKYASASVLSNLGEKIAKPYLILEQIDDSTIRSDRLRKGAVHEDESRKKLRTKLKRAQAAAEKALV